MKKSSKRQHTSLSTSEHESDADEKESTKKLKAMKDVSNHEENDITDEDDDFQNEVEDVKDEKESDQFSHHFNYEIPEDSSTKVIKYEAQKCTLQDMATLLYMGPPGSSPPVIKPPDLKASISASGMSRHQVAFLSLLREYRDVVYINGDGRMRRPYVMHILNHVLRSRAQILRHNSKLSKDPSLEFRDQGFVRPSALVMVPFRHQAFVVVNDFISALPGCVVSNKRRFETEFGPPPNPPYNKTRKPQDHQEMFEGNTDEDFRVGVRLHNKSIALYKDFYHSDLIVASPLGLRTIIGAEGDKDRDYDFLSSIEILVIDKAEVLLLQNPLHLLHVLKHLNLLPAATRGADFFRVRPTLISGNGKVLRQSIVIGGTLHPHFESLLLRPNCNNWEGYLCPLPPDPKPPPLKQLLLPLSMVFHWFDNKDPESEADDRFNFFVHNVLPDLKADGMVQTMIYIPSYFDFVRLRNYLRENEISCVTICEYSKPGKVAQARDVFFKGHRHFLLYTERAHFYQRYRIKGIQHIVFYASPIYPVFFRELCHFLLDARRPHDTRSVTLLASRPSDAPFVAAICGRESAKTMLKSSHRTFRQHIDNS